MRMMMIIILRTTILKSGDPVLGDPVLTVDCYQINNTDTPMKIKAFPQRGEIPFEPGDKIRLYKSRKWTKQSLLKLAGLHRFEVLKGLDEESKRAEHMPEPSWKDN